MFLKVFFPTEEESKAIKLWLKTKPIAFLNNKGSNALRSLVNVIFYFSIMFIIGIITYAILPYIPWQVSHNITTMVHYYIVKSNYLKVAFLMLSLGTMMYFPLLMCYLAPKGIIKILIGSIKLMIFTAKSSKKMYVERKESMLPMLEKDQLEKHVNVVIHTPKKKVKI